MRLPWVFILPWLFWLPSSLSDPLPIQITELAAAGRQGLRDQDGDTPDWIELMNVSTEPMNLEGWVLSEESRQQKSWTLPATNLPPDEFLVIFASGKDRSVVGQPLHTNFKLPTTDGIGCSQPDWGRHPNG